MPRVRAHASTTGTKADGGGPSVFPGRKPISTAHNRATSAEATARWSSPSAVGGASVPASSAWSPCICAELSIPRVRHERAVACNVRLPPSPIASLPPSPSTRIHAHPVLLMGRMSTPTWFLVALVHSRPAWRQQRALGDGAAPDSEARQRPASGRCCWSWSGCGVPGLPLRDSLRSGRVRPATTAPAARRGSTPRGRLNLAKSRGGSASIAHPVKRQARG